MMKAQFMSLWDGLDTSATTQVTKPDSTQFSDRSTRLSNTGRCWVIGKVLEQNQGIVLCMQGIISVSCCLCSVSGVNDFSMFTL